MTEQEKDALRKLLEHMHSERKHGFGRGGGIAVQTLEEWIQTLDALIEGEARDMETLEQVGRWYR